MLLSVIGSGLLLVVNLYATLYDYGMAELLFAQRFEHFNRCGAKEHLHTEFQLWTWFLPNRNPPTQDHVKSSRSITTRVKQYNVRAYYQLIVRSKRRLPCCPPFPHSSHYTLQVSKLISLHCIIILTKSTRHLIQLNPSLLPHNLDAGRT
jgi:hypothetical protein